VSEWISTTLGKVGATGKGFFSALNKEAAKGHNGHESKAISDKEHQ